uniref:Reverse transcriptase domain-containing protein n=1 Tax=Tanacetum cinerariifolium TaxID=118510 RepID=A0A699RPW6_TANCI|nr:hypothetical protein [Tanacetum cinerariifolium]
MCSTPRKLMNLFLSRHSIRSLLMVIKVPHGWRTSQTTMRKNKFFKDVKHYFWDDPHGHRLKHYFEEDLPKLVVPDLQTFANDH